jgi:cytochrome P450
VVTGRSSRRRRSSGTSKRRASWSRRSTAACPRAQGQPLLGSLLAIRRDDVHAFLDGWRRYGDTVRFRGPLTLYLLAHPDAVKHVLQDEAANYPRPPFVRNRLRAIVGDGLVGAEGADWVRSRRMAQPPFRRHQLDRYGPLFAEATADAWSCSTRSCTR